MKYTKQCAKRASENDFAMIFLSLISVDDLHNIYTRHLIKFIIIIIFQRKKKERIIDSKWLGQGYDFQSLGHL